MQAEQQALALLQGAGYHLLGQRLRTPFGEVDLLVENQHWLVGVEVKRRRFLSDSTTALHPRQASRLLKTLDYLLQTRPDWGRENTRFDLIAFDHQGQHCHLQDILRQY
nr:YraN family protein [Oecophyllibacter saccharovorans]